MGKKQVVVPKEQDFNPYYDEESDLMGFTWWQMLFVIITFLLLLPFILLGFIIIWLYDLITGD